MIGKKETKEYTSEHHPHTGVNPATEAGISHIQLTLMLHSIDENTMKQKVHRYYWVHYGIASNYKTSVSKIEKNSRIGKPLSLFSKWKNYSSYILYLYK